KDAGRYGIHVNAICPGPIASEMTRGYAYSVAAQPIARMGTPRDVAPAVLFLASQMSNYVTGQTLNVDGGILMDSNYGTCVPDVIGADSILLKAVGECLSRVFPGTGGRVSFRLLRVTKPCATSRSLEDLAVEPDPRHHLRSQGVQSREHVT